MDEMKLPDEMRDVLRASWHHYLDQLQPLRPQLHAYCRRLTRDLWDAEDLVQESLLKAFGLLGRIDSPIRNPRAYLLRIATNLWIDTLRRRDRERWRRSVQRVRRADHKGELRGRLDHHRLRVFDASRNCLNTVYWSSDFCTSLWPMISLYLSSL